MIVVSILGNAGAEPTLRTVGNTQAASVRLAVSYKEKGEDKTEWYPVTFWGKQADTAMSLIKKGSKVFVSGRGKTRSYTTKSGETRSEFEISASEFQMASAKGANDTSTTNQAKVEDNGFEDDDIPPF